MNQPAICCRDNETLAAAAQLMWENDCGALPVIDGNGRLIGMITDRDICMATFTQGCAPHSLFVRNAMESSVATCHPDDSLARAEHLMQRKQIRRLPVVDARERPVGFLSLADIARQARIPPSVQGDAGISAEEVLRTLAAISYPETHTLSVPRPMEDGV